MKTLLVELLMAALFAAVVGCAIVSRASAQELPEVPRQRTNPVQTYQVG